MRGDCMQVQNLTKVFGEQCVLSQFSLTIDAGICGLLGPSGCGKSTLLNIICGLLPPDSGEVNVPARIGYLFQEDRLLPWATALENVALVTAQPDQWLTRVGLPTEAHTKLPQALSGGMQRRVALARALAYPSELLLLDEPFRGLDVASREALYPLIREASLEKPVLLVTHDRADAEALADRILYLSGPPLTALEA